MYTVATTYIYKAMGVIHVIESVILGPIDQG